MATLVVSPHLDDAVLSLGATIHRWVSAGERVVIASMYTRGPALDEVPRSMRKFADYRTRLAEDRAACAVIGAERRTMGCIERAFRRPFLTGTQYFTTPADRSGFGALSKVTAALDELLELDAERIVLPMGIGNHVDHVETMVAATDWAATNKLTARVWFYEDFYALSDVMRRQHPIARRRRWKPWQAPLLRARRLSVILGAVAAGRRGPPIDQLLSARWRKARWTVEPQDITDHEAAKLAAIQRYPSQTKAFGGYAGIARALVAYHRFWGGAEPLWRATAR
ncbi:MAG: PIG-L deacetylase family protein [Kofleriaceae bacterium]